MSERRSNYTGTESDKKKKYEPVPENKTPRHHITPIMVLNDIGRRWRQIVDDGAPTQFMQNSSRAILRELSFKTGLCQLDLSRSTNLKPPTISVALQKMEAEGLVMRVVDDVDMRATRVYLTEKGKSINEQLFERFRTADEIALEGLSEEELLTLTSLLERVRNNLVKAQEEK